ncbi:MAG: PQQ-dependent sugar dehydrogenase [Deltaproteobacteria bacterium]|nr:PQQ-dependent sugar dehydrogenase [Deltaproteobacteria bacterium]
MDSRQFVLFVTLAGMASCRTSARAPVAAVSSVGDAHVTAPAALPEGFVRVQTRAGPLVLPPPYHTPSVSHPAHVVARPHDAALRVPEGCTVTPFATGLARPRQLAVSRYGEVFVTEVGAQRVSRWVDSDNDGIAETHSVFADGLTLPYGVVVHPEGWLYVANTNAVLRWPLRQGQTRAQGPAVRVMSLPGLGYNQHWTRALALSADGSRMVVSVGSETNVEAESDPMRGAITECHADGTECHRFAAGIRNATALQVHPQTGALFAVNNERDELGDDLPPDAFSRIERGGFYGWPYAYWGPHEDPRRRGERRDLVAITRAFDVSLGAHSAPTGLLLATPHTLGGRLESDALVSLHGSWNRSEFIGYHVVRVGMRGGEAVGPVVPWITGWTVHPGAVWGRPAGLGELPDGSVLVVDDTSNTVFRVSCLP